MSRLILRSIFVLALCGLVVACSSAPVSDKPHRDMAIAEAMGRAAIVTVGSPRLDPGKPSSISWLGSLDVIGEHPVLSAEDLQQQLTAAINEQIMLKGYSVVPQEGDFQLQAVVVLVDQHNEGALLRQSGGTDPGLASKEQLSCKGTLVLELRQGRITRWKGTVQIYVAPQAEREIALQRINVAIAQLLSVWP